MVGRQIGDQYLARWGEVFNSLSLSPLQPHGRKTNRRSVLGCGVFSVVGFPIRGLLIASCADQSPVFRGRKSRNG
ncbi:hypothetical protein RHMOL_Rhmol09G0214100 [Rhododendron molle]|uniref:Uncharacterized protein n=1 Tax=Rhododendron molle TaxID=49168 RepID=A0ACC0MH61_RHOML|nr:hypothetical protein RHMOL_Rhmol09G0214100 [Rhododendron molle]